MSGASSCYRSVQRVWCNGPPTTTAGNFAWKELAATGLWMVVKWMLLGSGHRNILTPQVGIESLGPVNGTSGELRALRSSWWSYVSAEPIALQKVNSYRYWGPVDCNGVKQLVKVKYLIWSSRGGEDVCVGLPVCTVVQCSSVLGRYQHLPPNSGLAQSRRINVKFTDLLSEFRVKSHQFKQDEPFLEI